MAQYRYSNRKFKRALAAAAGITGLACALSWMVLTAFGVRDPLIWSAIAAAVFFMLVSLPTIRRYLANDVVLAIVPTGIYDARISNHPLAWEEVREVAVLRRENEYALEIRRWPKTAGRSAPPVNIVELDELDGTTEEIIRALAHYARIVRDENTVDLPVGG